MVIEEIIDSNNQTENKTEILKLEVKNKKETLLNVTQKDTHNTTKSNDTQLISKKAVEDMKAVDDLLKNS